MARVIMKIYSVSHYSKRVHEALNLLLPQLSPTAGPIVKDDLIELIASEASHLLMAEKEGRYIGTLTLVLFKIPTGNSARIEDLVVADHERGQGTGRLLIEQALALARDLGAGTVSLTSNPSREAANALYPSIGFQRLNTRVYLLRIVQ